MRVWVLGPSEPVVFHPDMAHFKPMRAGMLCRFLARRGHEVVWWTSAFQHYTKQHIGPTGKLLPTEESNLSLFLLPSPGYKRHISLARMIDHTILARNWRRIAERMPPPDIIVASWPPVETGHAAVRFGRRHGIPVLLDARDMLPDVIYERLCTKLHLPFMPRFIWHYEHMTRQTFMHATGIMGITEGFLRWGLAKAGRKRRAVDATFFLSSPPLTRLDEATSEKMEAFWRSKGVVEDGRKVNFAWVGSLGDLVAARNLLNAIARLPEDMAARMQVVICGSGTLENKIADLASRHKHIIFPGYVSRDQLAWLLPRSDIGLLAYDRTQDFQASLPNKTNEYLGAGMHILTTLSGEIKNTLGPRGVVYFMEPDTEAQMTAISRLVEKGKLSKDERERARACYMELFSADKIYNAMADHIETVASKKILSAKTRGREAG